MKRKTICEKYNIGESAITRWDATSVKSMSHLLHVVILSKLFIRCRNIQFECTERCSDRRMDSMSPLLQADLHLIFPSARWILDQLLSISICAKVKSLWDLGLNMGCLATALCDPLNPILFQCAWTSLCGIWVSEGEAWGDGGGRSGLPR